MASVLDLVKHYQSAIEKYPHDEQKVLKCIDKLFNLGVTVQHLQETGVGRTVNALRKEPGDVGQAARSLVYKWKLMVAAEESDNEEQNNDTSTYNGHGSGKDSDDNTHRSGSLVDRYEKSESTPKSKEHKDMNGSYSGSKRKYHSSEEEEPHKRLKHSSSSEDDYNRKSQSRSKKDDSDSDSSDNSQSDESDSEMSESSQEEVKVKQEIKKEPTSDHKSSSSKYSSYGEHSDDKNSIKKLHESDKHSYKHSSHSEKSSSKEKSHSSEKSNHSSSKHNSHSVDKHSSHNSDKHNSHSSDRHKSSKEKESSSEKKHKTDHKTDADKSHKESKSSKHSSSHPEKHKSSSQKTDSGSDKHKSSSDKHSKSEKHKSSSHSHSSEKEKHKSSSEKEPSKHKSKESTSNDKSSSSKNKSKEKSSSSKEKSSSDKKHSSSSEHKSSEKKSSSSSGKEKGSEKKSSHKSSSSSSHKSSLKSSSGSKKEDAPKKKVQINEERRDSDDGIDCGSGASFAEALGMIISPAKSKKNKGSSQFKDATSPNSDLSPAALLAPSAKLAPLPALEISGLPEISPNYKPRPPPRPMPHFSDEDAISAGISSKNQRTKVYSGNKVIGKIPSLYEMCVHVLQEHIDALEFTGGVPYEILKPVVDKATPQQLYVLEHFNNYLMDDTDHLWQTFCQKHFRNKQRQELETWREMYARCQEEQEHKLKSLTANIRIAQEAKKAPIKQTKMAYVDSVAKPPRNIAKKQATHGTARLATASPAARVASLAHAPNVLRAGATARAMAMPGTPGPTFQKPKKAPLMAKALQIMRGRKR